MRAPVRRFGELHDGTHDDLVERIQAVSNSEIVPRHLAALQAALEAGRTDWLAGTPRPSIADFLWARQLETMDWPAMSGGKQLAEDFPQLAVSCTLQTEYRDNVRLLDSENSVAVVSNRRCSSAFWLCQRWCPTRETKLHEGRVYL